jgi:hypothetical protein
MLGFFVISCWDLDWCRVIFVWILQTLKILLLKAAQIKFCIEWIRASFNSQDCI